MTQAQFLGLCCLFLFGLVYDLIVVAARDINGRISFMAAFVILGLLITFAVMYLDSQGAIYSIDTFMLILLAHCAASGFGMTWGSWQRR